MANPSLTEAMVSYYGKTLRGLSLTSRAEKTRSFLASSPVKLLSNLWGGGGGSVSNTPDVTAASGSKNQRTPSLRRSNSHHSIFGSVRGERPPTGESRPENPLVRLEQTFTGFIAALQGRKGSIIGRTLLSRSMVDELTVNDLYNRLIESPFDYEAGGELGTEVIFVAFENFLRVAWAEQMGSVMTMQALDTLQERANKRVPGNFADFVNYLFKEMAPQNRRAFTAIIKLLADLLDGCGNDSDRGALTLAFAELLVTDGSAPNYINLLDRLVEDCDRIFEDPWAQHGFNFAASGADSISSGSRPRAQTGSVTSNASSLRRKFGLDMLLRQNQKEERPSVWRSLSKHRNPATGESPSLSRATMGRTRSIDDSTIPRRLLGRPGSRDRPPIAGAFDEAPPRPPSSHRLDFPLDTIGEPCSTTDGDGHRTGTKRGKKKRRSSLSDLKNLMASATLDDGEPPPEPLQATKETSGKVNSTATATQTQTTPVTSPKDAAATAAAAAAATPSRIPMSPNAAHALKGPRQKENQADPFSGAPLTVGPPLMRPDVPLSSMSVRLDSPTKLAPPWRPQDSSPIKRRGHSKTLSSSSIPMLKPSRPATAGGDSATAGPGSPTRTGTMKLRLQSPQRLRERLQTEKKAAGDVGASLQRELSQIGEEMTRADGGEAHEAGLRQLAASVKALEDKVPAAMDELMDRQAAMQRALETTVRATESKLRAIDQLHKEAVAENELLYEKFNSELGKIVKALRSKGKDDREELVTRMREQSEETARLKKENARLRRDMASLRAALKGMEAS